MMPSEVATVLEDLRTLQVDLALCEGKFVFQAAVNAKDPAPMPGILEAEGRFIVTLEFALVVDMLIRTIESRHAGETQ